MNKVQSREVVQYIKSNPLIVEVFDKTLLSGTVLEDGAELLVKDDGKISKINFILGNLSVINIKRFLTLGAYALKELTKQNDSSRVKKMYSSFIEFAKRYVSENDNIVIYLIDTEEKITIITLDSIKEIYGKKYPTVEFKLEEYLPQILRGVRLNNIKVLFNNHQLSEVLPDILTRNILTEFGYSEKDIENLEEGEAQQLDQDKYEEALYKEVLHIFTIPEIKSDVLEDNLYVVFAYEYLDRLKECTEKLKQNKTFSLESLETIGSLKALFQEIEKVINPHKVKIGIKFPDTDNEPFRFTIPKFREDYEETFEEYTMCLINISRLLLFDSSIIKYLKKQTALDMLGKFEDDELKNEYYYILYQAGHISYNEMLEYELNHGENKHDIAIRTLLSKLTGEENVSQDILERLGYFEVRNEIKVNNQSKTVPKDDILGMITDPKRLYSKSLKENDIYEILDEELKLVYAKKSMEEYSQNGMYSLIAVDNIKVLADHNDLDNDFIINMYSSYGMSFDELEEIIGKDKLKNIFDPKEFTKFFKEFIEIREKVDRNEEEKAKYKIMIRKYAFYKELQKRYNILSNKDLENELINELDDLLFSEEIFKEMYQNEFVTIENLFGLNQELAIKLYNEGALRKEDRKYVILTSSIMVKAGDLIRLHKDGIFDEKQIFSLYMSNRTDLEDLISFAEGIEFKEIFTNKDLLDRIKKISINRSKESILDFRRFIDAYSTFVGYPEEEAQKNIYRMLKARNEDIIYLYSKKIIDLKVLDSIDNKLLIELIRSGLLRAEDTEFFFKDNSRNGKYNTRLNEILPYLDDEQRINTIASLCSSDEDISEDLTNEIKRYLKAVISVKNKKESKSQKTKCYTRESYEPGEDQTEDISKRLIKICKVCREINPDCELILIGGTLVANLGKYVIVEDLYYTNSLGNNRVVQDRATYIISEDIKNYMSYDSSKSLYENIISETGFKIVEYTPYYDDEYTTYFDWETLKIFRRGFRNNGRIIRVPGVDKCTHVSNWERNLKKKVGYKCPEYDKKVKEFLKEMEESKKLGNTDQDDDGEQEL